MPRVLIADDDEVICDILTDFLTDVGMASAFAYTVSEAVALAAEFRPDVALVDLVMPETGGFDLVEKLKASDPGIRIVIITGEIDTLESGDLALKAGVEAIVQKPFQMKELMQAIEG